ncbi:hypothetical protein M0R45_031723 [Rubus argutus]|uniref:Uncharacterized protein n=1 Tax=Rubus argutus TaxID=59490 RepID=A0AAW1WJ02_RUBAR
MDATLLRLNAQETPVQWRCRRWKKMSSMAASPRNSCVIRYAWMCIHDFKGRGRALIDLKLKIHYGADYCIQLE